MEYYMNEDTAWLRRAIHWAADVVLVIAVSWFLVYGFCQQVRISGNSMQPLLDPGDVVLVNRLAYDLAAPSRFDVVVFEREDHQKNVKRVVGLPGETVQIRGGVLYIDNQPLEGEEGLEQVSIAGLAELPIHLGEDEYFLLGDNRDSSEDSRFSNIGNVKREQIKGRVWLRILPVLNLKLITSS